MDKLSIIRQPIATQLDILNQVLSESLNTTSPLMNQVTGNYLKTKGKQIRPILVLLCAKLFGDVKRISIDAAAAIELLHNASLIHDDVVDESQKRRGTPTVNSIWDNRIAVLVGDYFVSCALKCSINTHNIKIIDALGTLGQELSRGEIDQISNAREHTLDENAYFDVIRRKTASLFFSCMRIGAISADAPEDKVRSLELFGEKLGICFQIKDDIFDYFEDKTIGKPTGNDLREGKMSLPLIYAITHGEGEENQRMRSLLSQKSLSTPDIELLINYAKNNGGIEYAYETMQRIRQEAIDIIQNFPPSSTLDALISILDYTIERDK